MVETSPPSVPPCPDGAARAATAQPRQGAMVLIPAGCRERPFSIGGRDTVGCLRSFWMDTTEFTIQDYELYVGDDPSHLHPHNSCLRCPVENLTWFEAVLAANERTKIELSPADTVYSYSAVLRDSSPAAQEWAQRTVVVSDLAGLEADTTRRGFRLPSRKEWVYAALQDDRIGVYWNTTAWTIDSGNGQLVAAAWDPDWRSYAWFKENSGGTTRPAAGLLPNAWSLYDMLGNSLEWVSDVDSLSDTVGSRYPVFRVYGDWNAIENGYNNPANLGEGRSIAIRQIGQGVRFVRNADPSSSILAHRCP